MEPRKATVIPESMGLSRTIQHGVEKMGEEATSQQSSKTPAKKEENSQIHTGGTEVQHYEHFKLNGMFKFFSLR